MSSELEREPVKNDFFFGFFVPVFLFRFFCLGSEKVWAPTLVPRWHFRLSGAEEVAFRRAKHPAHHLLLAQFLRARVRLTSSKQVPGAARISFRDKVRVRFSCSEEVASASVSGCWLGIVRFPGSQEVTVTSGPFVQVGILDRVPFKTSPRSNKDKNKIGQDLFQDCFKGAFINDVTQFWSKISPPPCHAEMGVLPLPSCRVSNKYIPPACATPFVNGP